MEAPARLFFQITVSWQGILVICTFHLDIVCLNAGWVDQCVRNVQVLKRKFCVAERVALKSKNVCLEQFARQEAPPPSTVTAWFYRTVSEI